MTSALNFLEAVSGYTVAGQPNGSADRPIRFAKVDPAYNPFSTWPAAPPPARVTFEGETTLSTKAYALADGVVPMPGRRVWLVPAGNSYFIGGTIGGQDSQGFWSDGTDAGVEFGGGSYYSTEDGLVIAGPSSFTEPPVVDGVSQGKGLVAKASATTNSGNITTMATALALGSVTLEAGRAYEFKFGNGIQANAGSIGTIVDCRIHCTEMAAFVVEWFRIVIPLANQICHAQGAGGYVRNNTAGNLTRTFNFQMGFTGGVTGFHPGGANRARYVELWDVGAAADFPHATNIT